MTAQALLTEPEAAEALHLCTRTLRKARKEGRLTYVLIGRAVRYTMADLNDFIEAHKMTDATANTPKPRATTKAVQAGNIVPFSQRRK